MNYIQKLVIIVALAFLTSVDAAVFHRVFNSNMVQSGKNLASRVRSLKTTSLRAEEMSSEELEYCRARENERKAVAAKVKQDIADSFKRQYLAFKAEENNVASSHITSTRLSDSALQESRNVWKQIADNAIRMRREASSGITDWFKKQDALAEKAVENAAAARLAEQESYLFDNVVDQSMAKGLPYTGKSWHYSPAKKLGEVVVVGKQPSIISQPLRTNFQASQLYAKPSIYYPKGASDQLPTTLPKFTERSMQKAPQDMAKVLDSESVNVQSSLMEPIAIADMLPNVEVPAVIPVKDGAQEFGAKRTTVPFEIVPPVSEMSVWQEESRHNKLPFAAFLAAVGTAAAYAFQNSAHGQLTENDDTFAQQKQLGAEEKEQAKIVSTVVDPVENTSDRSQQITSKMPTDQLAQAGNEQAVAAEDARIYESSYLPTQEEADDLLRRKAEILEQAASDNTKLGQLGIISANKYVEYLDAEEKHQNAKRSNAPVKDVEALRNVARDKKIESEYVLQELQALAASSGEYVKAKDLVAADGIAARQRADSMKRARGSRRQRLSDMVNNALYAASSKLVGRGVDFTDVTPDLGGYGRSARQRLRNNFEAARQYLTGNDSYYGVTDKTRRLTSDYSQAKKAISDRSRNAYDATRQRLSNGENWISQGAGKVKSGATSAWQKFAGLFARNRQKAAQ